MFKNRDVDVENDFGKEWKTYNQKNIDFDEIKELFNHYFKIFPFEKISKNSEGFDMGCGSGRWAQFIAPKVKKLNCIEPSQDALETAKLNLEKFLNCDFENGDIMTNSLKENSQDFGYSLGVIHHIPDPKLGLINCVKKLKKGAPFLLYLYFKFDNKPWWYKKIWEITDLLRKIISKMPFKLKLFITQIIAITLYFPLAKISYFSEIIGLNVKNYPLSSYRNTSLYTMKTDALDRFGTKLEKRFTKKEILEMMIESGLTDIRFSNNIPYWVAIGFKK